MNSLSKADASVLVTTQSQPVASPLTLIKDALGESLQNTMIWVPPGTQLESSFVAFRKSSVLGNVPRCAMLHLFADARYMVWLNGQYVLRGPARFEPSGPEYDSMDVARFLKPGTNSIVTLVMANPSDKNGKMRRHAPGLTVALDADGKTTVSTDETWKWSDRTRYRDPAITWVDVSDRIDARAEDGD